MIQSDLDADPALDRFDKLWDRWWGDASGRPESWPLYIGVEDARELVQNRAWRKAGNQGKDILEYRRQADYDDDVKGLTPMMYSTLRIA